MTWEIILGLITLFGFGVAIVKPIVGLTNAITRLNASCDMLTRQFIEFDESNSKSHGRLWMHNEKQDARMDIHERRLHDLDGK